MSAFLAVLARDLRGAERTGLLGSARVLALVLASLLALTGLSRFRPGIQVEADEAFAVGAWGLMAMSLLFGAFFALGAFRTERQSGTLDLLLLAGISSRSLVLARTLSSFLVLQSLAVSALPALALFWFFRAPTLRGWLLHFVALTCWNAALAAISVAMSAWSRRPGTALAVALLLLPAFGALSLTEMARMSWSAPGLVWMTAESQGTVDASRAFLCLGFHAAIVGVAIVLGTLALEHRGSDLGLEAADPKPARRRHPSDERPLSWLLTRCSAAARPALQLLALLGGLVVVAIGVAIAGATGSDLRDLLDPRALSAAGGALSLLALATVLAAGATRIAAERERRTWTCIASTSRGSDRLFGDLLVSTIQTCFVPFLLGAGFLVAAELARGQQLHEILHGVVSLLVSICLIGLLALSASACTRSTATALALASVLALAVPTIVAGCRLLTGGFGGLEGRSVGLLLLVLALGLPVIARGAGPFVLLWISAWREQRRGAKATGRLISVPLGILVPLALLTGLASGPNDSPWAVAFGGLHVAVVHLVTFGDERGLLDGSLVFQGLLWQALFAMLVLAGLWRKRDLWLGRAST